MAIRLIATDMDDTLLNEHGLVSERTKAAVTEAMRRGVRFVLASGRMPQAMRATALQLKVNSPAICFNGGMIADLIADKILHAWPVEQELAREAAKMAENLGGHVQAFRDGTYFYEAENDFSRAYAKSIDLTGHATGEKISQCFTGGANKLLIIGQSADIAVWVQKMQAHFGSRLCCAVSRPNYIEVFRSGIDKAVALGKLAEEYGLEKDEIAAFGDGENDLGMVSFAGHGYIMANAREKVLAQAKNIAPANSCDGLAQVLEGWFEDGTIPQEKSAQDLEA